MRALLVVVVVAACGSPHDPASPSDASAPIGDAKHASSDAAVATDGTVTDTAVTVDAFPSVLDVHIDCHNTCVLAADPAAIDVSAGTSFQVNWINVGDTECDVTKVDMFNHVPIILGLEPGMSYHDSVHDWCGPEFTGMFDFEILICTLPSEIPVNCGA